MSVSPQAAKEMTAPALAETLPQDEAARERAQKLSAPRQTPPAEVPGYDIQRCLGNGAYGSVWLAVERNTGKQVAIKFYSHRRGVDWSLLSREVEKLAILYTSREIVGLLEVGWEADPPYYVMEYLQNGSLAQMLDRGALSVAEAVRIATAVAGALVQAQQQGILHCDVKPANVLLDSDFSARLADFGQSRLSYEQTPALGTMFYMAPEQADLDAAPDPRWDVYALGALLYHMLVGDPPFRTPDNERRVREAVSLEDKLKTYRQIVEESPRPAGHRIVSGVDARLVEIVDRCLAAAPMRRFADAAAVAEALAARARYRSLRPAIGLGIVLPGLLLLGLFPLAVLAVRSAAETAEANIAARALESDTVAAKILAYSLNDDLDQRMRTLTTNIGGDPEFMALLPGLSQPADSEARQRLGAFLSAYKAGVDEVRRELNSDLDASWFLTDTHGVQRWREPPSRVSFEENYSDRDYFHGQGADRPEWRDRTDIPPLSKPHMSAPFRSSTDGSMKIALSAPVRDAGENIVGVLTRTIELGRLLSSYKKLLGDDERDARGERVIALLDVRNPEGRILDHPWMAAIAPERLAADAVFNRLTLWPAERTQLIELQRRVRDGLPIEECNSDRNYRDPISQVDRDAESAFGMPWLAAFWPVGDKGLFAVVQERRAAALAPVREIRDGLYEYGAAGLLLCVTLVACSWYFVGRVVRTATLPAGRRSNGRAGSGASGSGVVGSG